jgi:hypothetical protein
MATKLYSEMTPEEQREIDAQEDERESYKEFLNDDFCLHGNTSDFCEVCHPELESDEDYEKRVNP